MPQKNTEGSLPLVNAGTVWLPSARAGHHLVASHFFRSEPRVRELEAMHVEVLERSDGEHSPAAIAAEIQRSPAAVERCIEWWRTEAPAALLFRPAQVDLARALRVRAAAKALLGDWLTAQATSTSTTDFHRERLGDPYRNFERNETTISYLLSAPHPLLQGQPYGARVADRLMPSGNLPLRILEIGPGLGLLAAAFLDRVAETAPAVYAGLSYTLLDLAPSLIAAQRLALRDHSARTRWIEGDAETAALESGSFDVILCNEAIADLSVGFAYRGRLGARDAHTAAERAILDYELPYEKAPERFVLNLGAIRLLERLSEWLAPGGRAWITEYGGWDVFPTTVRLPGHVEYSVRFDHLQKTAERLGLDASCEPLGTWLGIDETVEVMRADDGSATAGLLMPALGLKQPSRPWLVTRERLRAWLGGAASSLGHRGFFPVSAGDEGLSPANFLVLTLRQHAR